MADPFGLIDKMLVSYQDRTPVFSTHPHTIQSPGPGSNRPRWLWSCGGT